MYDLVNRWNYTEILYREGINVLRHPRLGSVYTRESEKGSFCVNPDNFDARFRRERIRPPLFRVAGAKKEISAFAWKYPWPRRTAHPRRANSLSGVRVEHLYNTANFAREGLMLDKRKESDEGSTCTCILNGIFHFEISAVTCLTMKYPE